MHASMRDDEQACGRFRRACARVHVELIVQEDVEAIGSQEADLCKSPLPTPQLASREACGSWIFNIR